MIFSLPEINNDKLIMNYSLKLEKPPQYWAKFLTVQNFYTGKHRQRFRLLG